MTSSCTYTHTSIWCVSVCSTLFGGMLHRKSLSPQTDEGNCSWLHPIWPLQERSDRGGMICMARRTSTKMILCMHRQRVQTASVSLRLLSGYQRVKIAGGEVHCTWGWSQLSYRICVGWSQLSMDETNTHSDCLRIVIQYLVIRQY